jgi:transposase
MDAALPGLDAPWSTLAHAVESGRRGGRRAPAIRLKPDERFELERVVRAGSSEQRAVLRARIVLFAADGFENVEIARRVCASQNTVGLWRRRFSESGPAGLRDAPRSGRPSRFTAEQRARVIQKATEETPSENGLPFTHWSAKDLSRVAREAGIVESIHPSTVWKWLNAADVRPHRCRYWLRITDPEFEERMQDVTGIYLQTPDLAERGVPVFCFDEKTSIQALERWVPDRLARPGKPHQRDDRYRRHGTTHLLGAFQVSTGKVWGRFAENRRGPVIAAFVRELVESVPEAPEVHLVMDQASTHTTHEVCRVVARLSGLRYDPKAYPTKRERRDFLLRKDKRIVVHFTPVRGSWLDQIEIWFSYLQRKVLDRGSFASVLELQQRIFGFMDHYNRFLAHPYRWTYTGTPCRA